jgi:hypothetical protein
MSLSEGVQTLATRIGTEVKTLRSEVTSGLSGKANASHTHPSTQISDATTVGRNVLTAANAAAARTAIGAGTSDLVIGTTAGTAKAGNWVPAWSDVTGKPSTFTPASHTHPASEISDSTTVGRAVLTAASAAAARSAIGAGTGNSDLVIGTTAGTAKEGNWVPSWSDVTGKPSTFTPSSHTHPASQISDATTVGRNVLTASDAAAARSAIGAGTSNLALGSTSGTAAAGNHNHDSVYAAVSHTHTASQISDSTATGRSVLTAASAAAARSAIGAGTSDLTIGTTGSTAAAGNHTHSEYAATSHTHTASQISDSTTTGRSVLTASNAGAARTAIAAAAITHVHSVDDLSDASLVGKNVLTALTQTAARSAIGAGTSNLTIGTTGSTAAAGNHNHDVTSLSDTAWASYTPTWYGSTTNPATSHTRTGAYKLIGKTVFFTIKITVGSGGVGSGLYSFSLPLNSVTTRDFVCWGLVVVSGSGEIGGVAKIEGGTPDRVARIYLVNQTRANNWFSAFGNTFPSSLPQGSVITITGQYETP